MDILKNKNFAFSTLNANILIDGLSVTVLTGEGIRFPSTGYFMAVIWGSAYAAPSLDSTREIVKATLTTDDTFAITRAQEGTTAKAWPVGSNIALVITAGKLDELEVATQGHLHGFATGTGTNTYSAILSPAVTSYAHGAMYNIKFVNASTGVCTLGLNAVGVKKLYKYSSGVISQATTGDITDGMYSSVFYDSSLDSSNGGFILVTSKISFPSEFASTTALLFPQSSAPTGWTLDSSWSTPRSLVLGNDYGSGGSDSAVSFTTGITVGDHVVHTHSISGHSHTGPSHAHGSSIGYADLPAHTHSYHNLGHPAGSSGYFTQAEYGGVITGASTTGSTGNGAGHSHGDTGAGGTGNTSSTSAADSGSGGSTTHTVGQSTYSPRYVTLIRATKN